MFDFFRKHTRMMQFLLVLLIFPSFVFFGIRSYTGSGNGDNPTVATVAGQKITRSEWEAAQRQQMERLRQQMPNFDPKIFDTPDMKKKSLEALVRDRVMLVAADKLNLAVTDDRLQHLFSSDPQLQMLRNPDGSINKEVLAAQGMTSDMFAQQYRQSLAVRQVLAGVDGSVIATLADTSAALDAMLQQREAQVQRFDAKDSVDKVNPTDADIDKYYKDPANADQFKAPEQADIEYVVLDLDSVKKSITVSDDDLHKYYDQNAARYTTPEERHASHILIKVDKSAPAADRAKAKAKAEELLAEVKKNPASFADVARKNSQDPGSAEKGGDLDWFGRGQMVKPFEDAVFSLKPGQISDVIETDFGYHIIEVTGARGGEKQAFDAVRKQIEDEVKNQLAQKRYSELAVDFGNTVYEQSDTFKPAVEKFKVDLRTANNVPHTPKPGTVGPLASSKFLDALFSADSIRTKRNTEAVETAPNQLVSGRILRYTAAHQLPLADVKTKIHDRLVMIQSAALARKQGEALLAALRSNAATPMGGTPIVVSRAQTKDQPREVIDAILKAPADKLPAFAGADLGDLGYAVVKVTKVLGRDPAAGDAKAAQGQYAQAWADAESQAYYAALKSRFKAEIRSDAIEAASAAASEASGTN
ncbi:MAG: SurA N-terminal domain-containing protein [Proteobacteria bacterium]|nr:SurA N-terminal domain-containing protein [Pseudomonadota bacterium]